MDAMNPEDTDYITQFWNNSEKEDLEIESCLLGIMSSKKKKSKGLHDRKKSRTRNNTQEHIQKDHEREDQGPVCTLEDEIQQNMKLDRKGKLANVLLQNDLLNLEDTGSTAANSHSRIRIVNEHLSRQATNSKLTLVLNSQYQQQQQTQHKAYVMVKKPEFSVGSQNIEQSLESKEQIKIAELISFTKREHKFNKAPSNPQINSLHARTKSQNQLLAPMQKISDQGRQSDEETKHQGNSNSAIRQDYIGNRTPSNLYSSIPKSWNDVVPNKNTNSSIALYSSNGSPGLNLGSGSISVSRNDTGSFSKPTLYPSYIAGSGEQGIKSLIKLPRINAVTKSSIEDRTMASVSPTLLENSSSSPGLRLLRNGSESPLKTTKRSTKIFTPNEGTLIRMGSLRQAFLE